MYMMLHYTTVRIRCIIIYYPILKFIVLRIILYYTVCSGIIILYAYYTLTSPKRVIFSIRTDRNSRCNHFFVGCQYNYLRKFYQKANFKANPKTLFQGWVFVCAGLKYYTIYTGATIEQYSIPQIVYIL